MTTPATENTLDAQAMLARAQAETGLSDWSDATLPKRFGLAVDQLNAAAMDADGRRQAAEVCHWLLTSRLEFFEDRNRYPIADEVIERPMFVTGEPRTGTTLMHALMSVDPEARALSFWEVMYPSPPPGSLARTIRADFAPTTIGVRSTPSCRSGCIRTLTTTCSATACPRTNAPGPSISG